MERLAAARERKAAAAEALRISELEISLVKWQCRLHVMEEKLAACQQADARLVAWEERPGAARPDSSVADESWSAAAGGTYRLEAPPMPLMPPPLPPPPFFLEDEDNLAGRFTGEAAQHHSTLPSDALLGGVPPSSARLALEPAAREAFAAAAAAAAVAADCPPPSDPATAACTSSLHDGHHASLREQEYNFTDPSNHANAPTPRPAYTEPSEWGADAADGLRRPRDAREVTREVRRSVASTLPPDTCQHASDSQAEPTQGPAQCPAQDPDEAPDEPPPSASAPRWPLRWPRAWLSSSRRRKPRRSRRASRPLAAELAVAAELPKGLAALPAWRLSISSRRSQRFREGSGKVQGRCAQTSSRRSQRRSLCARQPNRCSAR